jgi:serine/threonine protein phosphatase PrpC
MKPSIIGLSVSEVGNVRRRNEDACLVRVERGLAAVADGMGGLPGGDRASALAVEAVGRVMVERNPDNSEGSLTGAAATLALAEAVARAQSAVLDEVEVHPDLQGMGSTLTVLLLSPHDASYFLAHVGDSRAYLLRAGELHRLTRDHTFAQQQVEMGRLSPDKVEDHPLGHILTRAIGLPEGVTPDLDQGPMEIGDLFCLCTDGLTKVVPDADLKHVLLGVAEAGEGNPGPGTEERLDRALGSLVEMAVDRGAPDNVTVALMAVTSPE